MKVIYNRILPFGKRFYAINLFGILFAKGPCDAEMLNHERIHTKQMKELGFILFYILYVLEWLIRLIKYKDSFKAYRTISFEREAYDNQYNLNYLNDRKIFSSFAKKYLLKSPG